MLALILGSTLIGGPTAQANDETWIAKARLNVPRWDVGAAELGGLIYAVGGSATYPDCTYTSTIEAYDPVNDTWTLKTSMPTKREGPGVAALGGLLYVVAGSRGCPGPTTVVEAYDPLSDSWSTTASLPSPRSRNAAVALGGLLYVIGGESTCEATMVSYDPLAGMWTSRPSLSLGGYGCWNGDLAAVALGGRIYVANFTGTSANMAWFDPLTGAWTAGSSVSSLPSCGFTRAAAVNGLIYIPRNEGPGGTTTWIYDPVSDAWSTGPSQQLNIACQGVAAVDGTLYAIGGLTSSASCGPADTLRGATCIKSETWALTPTPRLPTTKQQCKDTGWQSFGVFKNQGDCVSFVATKGRNQPSK
jgi:hypothetical protein